MLVGVVDAKLEDKPVLANLLELYHYDFTEFTQEDIAPDGRFGYSKLDEYWQDPLRFPFLIWVDGNLAGFTLVKRGSAITGDPEIMDVAEFFVMRKYRRKGVGDEAARRIFERFRGRWEVREMANNTAAQAFWRTTIERYVGRAVEEHYCDNERWLGPVQMFDSREIEGRR